MKLSKDELIKKFPAFKKYENKDWLQKLFLKNFSNLNDIPFSLCECLLNDLMEFLEKTKFSSRWEENFSTKVRVKQMLDILSNIQQHD